MDTRTREMISSDFEAGLSWTQIRQSHPDELREITFRQFLNVLGLNDYNAYHVQYEKYHSRARYKARSSSGFRTTKLQARERDGHRCVVCNIPAKTVHHIDEFKQSQDSEVVNLVTLCPKHHAAAHGKIGPFLMEESSGHARAVPIAVRLLEKAMREYAMTINRRTGRHLAVRTCREAFGREILKIIELPAARP